MHIFDIICTQNIIIMLETQIYQTFRNIPVSGTLLAEEIGRVEQNRPYANPAAKMRELESSRVVIRLKKGLYVLDGTAFGFPPSAAVSANAIYGPSYLSQQWALSYYGLIPERVNTLTSITTKHARTFENQLGTFIYSQVDSTYFAIGITTTEIDTASVLIATPEKALADLILTDRYVPYNSVAALRRYLEEDIRFDMSALAGLDSSILEVCANQERKSNIFRNLIKLIHKL